MKGGWRIHKVLNVWELVESDKKKEKERQKKKNECKMKEQQKNQGGRRGK